MSSGKSTLRRVPSLERGERRVAQLLDTAATVLTEVGYDAATMTEIAERAGASIGTLYQYFPNKEAIVLALQRKYVAEMEERWAHFNEAAAHMTVRQIAHDLVDLTVNFVEDHPAYYPVLDAPVRLKRSPEARQRLRERVAKLLRNKKPELSHDTAYRVINVAIQLIKSMHKLYAEADTREREELVKEYKLAVGAYLQSRLGS